jgi:hypothetical protein
MIFWTVSLACHMRATLSELTVCRGHSRGQLRPDQPSGLPLIKQRRVSRPSKLVLCPGDRAATPLDGAGSPRTGPEAKTQAIPKVRTDSDGVQQGRACLLVRESPAGDVQVEARVSSPNRP